MIKLLQKDNPTAFSPMGGLVPTQEKKKKTLDRELVWKEMKNSSCSLVPSPRTKD